jgi:hypothetical protein
MRKLWLWFLGGCALLSLVPSAPGAAGPGQQARPRGPYADADVIAARIDGHLARGWQTAKAVPARPADDSEFVRRVYLDLAGRIPSVSEVRRFLSDRRPDRRQRLVERLLDGPRYVTHFTQVYRALLLPEASSNFQVRFQVPGFETWLRGQLSKNAPYDEMVRELLTTPVGGPRGGGFAFPGGNGANPAAFYFAKDLKAEEIAGATARIFLGVNVGCAQCHNHPFADWKKEQFWSFAAFFSGIQSRRQGDFNVPMNEIANRRELTIPGTEKVVQARYLDGKVPVWDNKISTRATLANWMTSRDNPYFARAAVNRMWAYLFGHGLIDPIDEMVGTSNTASHPDLLDELAREFVAHKFDVKFMLRVLTSTRAYQLSSARSHKSQDDPRNFARFAMRGLTPEQLYDSVATATGYQENAPRGPFFGGNSPRNDFVTQFSNASDRPTEVQTSILQALTLMNGRLVSAATTLESSETLAAVVDSPFFNTRERIEVLYLSTVSRKPTTRELERLSRYVDGGGSAGPGRTEAEKNKRYSQGLADVFWMLLNSGEFFLNH